jgi:hypothetical protein
MKMKMKNVRMICQQLIVLVMTAHFIGTIHNGAVDMTLTTSTQQNNAVLVRITLTPNLTTQLNTTLIQIVKMTSLPQTLMVMVVIHIGIIHIGAEITTPTTLTLKNNAASANTTRSQNTMIIHGSGMIPTGTLMTLVKMT